LYTKVTSSPNPDCEGLNQCHRKRLMTTSCRVASVRVQQSAQDVSDLGYRIPGYDLSSTLLNHWDMSPQRMLASIIGKKEEGTELLLI
jgi:hypothetical protein